MTTDQFNTITDALLQSWSLQSSSKWTKDNPAKGQCGVTALVVNDLFGGEIMKTKLPGGWHFTMFQAVSAMILPPLNLTKISFIQTPPLTGKKPMRIRMKGSIAT